MLDSSEQCRARRQIRSFCSTDDYRAFEPHVVAHLAKALSAFSLAWLRARGRHAECRECW